MDRQTKEIGEIWVTFAAAIIFVAAISLLLVIATSEPERATAAQRIFEHMEPITAAAVGWLMYRWTWKKES